MKKKYESIVYIIDGKRNVIHEPCLTDSEKQARQKRWEKACLTFMNKVEEQKKKSSPL